MIRGVVFVFLLAACRDQIQLGDAADASVDAFVEAGPICPSQTNRTLVTIADSALGGLRAMAISADTVWLLSARDADGTGVLSRAPSTGGALSEIAQLGLDPAALSVSADGRYAFVALRGSSQVARVDATGTIVIANAGGAPESVVAADNGRAYWTLPATGNVNSWDFATGAPTVVVTSPHATSLLLDGTTLYITGAHALQAFRPNYDAAARLVAQTCDEGIPAIAGSVLFCADAGAIARVDLDTGKSSVVATAQTSAADVVIGNGRAFWRAAFSVTSFVNAIPIDAVSGPTVVESGQGGSLLIARDDCALYFTQDRTIWRRGF